MGTLDEVVTYADGERWINALAVDGAVLSEHGTRAEAIEAGRLMAGQRGLPHSVLYVRSGAG